MPLKTDGPDGEKLSITRGRMLMNSLAAKGSQWKAQSFEVFCGFDFGSFSNDLITQIPNAQSESNSGFAF